MLSLALYEQIKYSYVPETRIGRIYATQNDNKNDNRINPKTNFKHHHALIMETEQVISQYMLPHVDEPLHVYLSLAECPNPVKR